MPSRVVILISAAFGGISPNLLRLAVSLTKENADLPEVTYLIGLLIFGVMGAIVAFIWQETDLKRAFYLGIGLPALIQMGAGEISDKPAAAMMPQQRFDNFALQAASPAGQFSIITASLPREQPRQLHVHMNRFWKKCILVFSSPDTTGEITIYFKEGELDKTVDVPQFASSFQIKLGNTASDIRALAKDQQNFHFDVIIEKDRWSGLWEAIGVRSATTWQVSLQTSGKN